jgi:hypothetical protein
MRGRSVGTDRSRTKATELLWEAELDSRVAEPDRNWDSSVGMDMGYGLADRRVRVRVQTGQDFFLEVPIFWDILPCTPYMNRRFGKNYHLHLKANVSPKYRLIYGLRGVVSRSMR